MPTVFLASVVMYIEEVGQDPTAFGNTYERRAEGLVMRGHTFIRTTPAADDVGERVVSKVDVGVLAGDVAQIQGVWVPPDLRGRGIATLRIAAPVVFAREKVASTIPLYVNNPNEVAVVVYRKVGFDAVGEWTTTYIQPYGRGPRHGAVECRARSSALRSRMSCAAGRIGVRRKTGERRGSGCGEKRAWPVGFDGFGGSPGMFVPVLRMSSPFIRTLCGDPVDAEIVSHRLLMRAGYIRRVAPGIYTRLPLGFRVLRKIERIVCGEMEAAGSQEVHLPAFLPCRPYEALGRWSDHGPTLFKLKDRKESDYLLAPTHEELFTLLVKDMYPSYKDLLLSLYQTQTKYRNEVHSRVGVIRSREPVMKDAYSSNADEMGLGASYTAMRSTCQRIFARLDLPFIVCSVVSGAMGGSRSEEFLSPCETGEDAFVRSAGRYATNTEVVTTVPPIEVDSSSFGQPIEIAIPGASTIATLVDAVNEAVPKPDGLRTAADTPKDVVVVAVHPDSKREVIVVGLSGNRDVNMKRVGATLTPVEVEIAMPEDLEAYPELVPGHIGPQAVGPQSARPAEAEPPAPRCPLDPHVARESRWVTGASKPDVHMVGLVCGHGSEADGSIEAAEVRAEDEAPDGPGPLGIVKGIKVGHILQLGRKCVKALGLSVFDENGKSRTVTMGSYEIGITRVLAALAEENHDRWGLIQSASVTPAHVHIVAAGKDDALYAAVEEIAAGLEADGVEVLLNDRRKVGAGVKFADYELLGVSLGVIVGRGLVEGLMEIRDRVGEMIEAPVEQARERIDELVWSALSAQS